MVESGGICIAMGASPVGPYVSPTFFGVKPAYNPTIHAPNRYDVPSVTRNSVTSQRTRTSLCRKS